MILLSRAVAPSLLAGLLGFFFFVSARPHVAVGSSFIAADAFYAETDLSGPLFLETIQLDPVRRDQCSNLVVIQRWFRFTAPKTYRATESAKRLLVEQTNLADAYFQQLQEIQLNWFREKMTRARETSWVDFERLAAIWLPFKPASEPVDHNLVGELKLPDFVPEPVESAYWSYYRDCERWGVEFTGGWQQFTPGNVARAEVATDTRVENETSTSSPEFGGENLETIFAAFNRTAEWFGQALRSIEFAATESRVASRERSRRRSD